MDRLQFSCECRIYKSVNIVDTNIANTARMHLMHNFCSVNTSLLSF